jgi:hypothetical protein
MSQEAVHNLRHAHATPTVAVKVPERDNDFGRELLCWHLSLTAKMQNEKRKVSAAERRRRKTIFHRYLILLGLCDEKMWSYLFCSVGYFAALLS